MRYQFLTQRGALNDAQFDANNLVSEWESSATGLASTSKADFVDLSAQRISQAALDLVPDSVCVENACIPFSLDRSNDCLYVATADPDDIALADKLTFVLNRDVRLVAASARQVQEALKKYGKDQPGQFELDSMLCEFTETALDFTQTTPFCASSDVAVLDKTSRRATASGRAVRSSMKNQAGVHSMAAVTACNNPAFRPQQARPRSGMFYYMIPEGTRVMQTHPDGRREILVGPKRVWKGFSEFHEISHHVAHPGDYLIVRFSDGHQEHIVGPAEVWYDSRVHDQIERAEGLQISSQEAVVVYSQSGGSDGLPSSTARRIVHGPAVFVPQPGEWLHTFSWHASKGGSKGIEKVSNGLVFQKLWLMPDQMYHDVHDVRTADDAVLTIRLMIFFELADIERMLDATRDPIGDFLNAATADVVEFTGRYNFEEFKQNTGKLNELSTYAQLTKRAQQIGYHIHTVVYRGYGAANSLQAMHDQAIEARTKLQLDRATEQQAQELESFRLESQLARASKRRAEQADEVKHDLDLDRLRTKTELEIKESQLSFARDQRLADAKTRDSADRIIAAQQQSHFSSLRDMGVDLTAYLTQNRADQIFEFRGSGKPHLHVDPVKNGTKVSAKSQE